MVYVEAMFSYFPLVFLGMLSISSSKIFKIADLQSFWKLTPASGLPQNSLYWLLFPPLSMGYTLFLHILHFRCCYWKLEILNNIKWQLSKSDTPPLPRLICSCFPELILSSLYSLSYVVTEVSTELTGQLIIWKRFLKCLESQPLLRERMCVETRLQYSGRQLTILHWPSAFTSCLYRVSRA